MHFASPMPWWLLVVVAAAIAGIAYVSYRRPLARLAIWQKSTLAVLRALTLSAIVFFLCRPIVMMPPVGARDVVVPILVDVSRSMRVADAAGQQRIVRAAEMLKRDVL